MTPTMTCGTIVQEQLLPDDRGIAAKAALPEAVADDGDTLAAGPILVGREDAPEHGLALQHVEEGRRHAAGRDALRLPPPVEDGAVTGDGGNGFKDLVARPSTRRRCAAEPRHGQSRLGQFSSKSSTRRSAAGNGNGRSRTASNRPNTAVAPPMAIPIVRTAASVKLGDLHERPLRILQVAAEILDPHERPCLSMCVPYVVETPETTPRRSSRLVRRTCRAAETPLRATPDARPSPARGRAPPLRAPITFHSLSSRRRSAVSTRDTLTVSTCVSSERAQSCCSQRFVDEDGPLPVPQRVSAATPSAAFWISPATARGWDT